MRACDEHIAGARLAEEMPGNAPKPLNLPEIPS